MLTGAPGVHIEEQVTAFLLNGKEWEFLSEIRVDENAQSVDHRSVSFHLLAFKYNSCVFFSVFGKQFGFLVKSHFPLLPLDNIVSFCKLYLHATVKLFACKEVLLV